MVAGLSEDLKKIFLAGLGAIAVTSEKSKKVIDELVKKGELTMEQGKVLNEELKRNVSEKVKEHVTVNVTVSGDLGSIKEAIGKMSPEELQAVKTKISEVESAQSSGATQENANQ